MKDAILGCLIGLMGTLLVCITMTAPAGSSALVPPPARRYTNPIIVAGALIAVSASYTGRGFGNEGLHITQEAEAAMLKLKQDGWIP